MTIKVVQVVTARVVVAPTQVLIGAEDVTWKASTHPIPRVFYLLLSPSVIVEPSVAIPPRALVPHYALSRSSTRTSSYTYRPTPTAAMTQPITTQITQIILTMPLPKNDRYPM